MNRVRFSLALIAAILFCLVISALAKPILLPGKDHEEKIADSVAAADEKEGEPLEEVGSVMAAAEIQVVEVYYTCSEEAPGGLYPVTRKVPEDIDPLQAAIEEMLCGPTEEEQGKGYRSLFSHLTAGMLRSVKRSADGQTVTLDFADFRNLFGENDVPRPTSFGPGGVMADITWTVFKQFPEVQALRFAFAGDEGAFWSWLAGKPTEPQAITRTDWEQI